MSEKDEEVIDEEELDELLEEVKGEIGEEEEEIEETNGEEVELELEPETKTETKTETEVSESTETEEAEVIELEEESAVEKKEEKEKTMKTGAIKPVAETVQRNSFVAPVCSVEDAVRVFKQFEDAKRKVLSSNDILWIGDDGTPTIEGQGTPYIKRSGWRKLARFFGLSWDIKDTRKVKMENGGYMYIATVKVWHPAGASIVAEGVATSEDRFFTKGGRRVANEGNVLMKAITVAINRGISDILGCGEVSGEEEIE